MREIRARVDEDVDASRNVYAIAVSRGAFTIGWDVTDRSPSLLRFGTASPAVGPDARCRDAFEATRRHGKTLHRSTRRRRRGFRGARKRRTSALSRARVAMFRRTPSARGRDHVGPGRARARRAIAAWRETSA